MAVIHLENVPDEVYEKLQQLAANHNRPIDAQAIALLENGIANQTQTNQRETTKSITEILEESRRRREQLPTDVPWSDSTALIREDRAR